MNPPPDANPPLPRRMKLVLAYDGRHHSGWQHVGDGRSVQEQLEAAIAKILKSDQLTRVHASGRTDAGVHALAQVAHFDVPGDWRMDGAAWTRALNPLLPPSIRVLETTDAPPGFHARRGSTGKHYRYRLFNGRILPPLDHGVVWHWPWPLDTKAMIEAAPVFLGEHDFSAFAAFRHDGTDAAPESGKNIRRVWRFDVTVEGPYVTMDIEGKGFLYKMVRLMVGALVHVGRGSLDGAGLRGLFEAKLDKTGRLIKSPLCAGAEGLTMVEVFYEPRGGDKV